MKIAGLPRKFLRFMVNFAIVAVMLVYVSAGVFSALALYARDGYRTQPLSALSALIDSTVQKGDTSDVSAWLAARPLAETDAELRVLAPKSGGLGAPVFFAVFRRELKLGRPREALFWLQLGRYRLRYDLLRCGATPAQARVFKGLLESVPMPQISALLAAHPAALRESLQRVLDFDAKYPATDDPAHFCKLAVPDGTPADRVDWPLYRAALRRMTENYIKTQTENPPAQKPVKKTSAKKDKKEKRK